MIDETKLRELCRDVVGAGYEGASSDVEVQAVVDYVLASQKSALDAKTAMRLAKESYASTSDKKEVRNSMPAPAPHITMTAGNLLKFFQLASKEYQP